MLAKFKDGTPCTIRALLAFAEKCGQNFIDLTEDWDILIRSIDRKANGRIKHIDFSVMKPLIINGEKTNLYKIETRFDGNEKSANDFLDDEVFAKGIRIDEEKMTTPFTPPLDKCIQLSADQEKAIEAVKTLMSYLDPELLSWSTKWLLRSMQSNPKMKDEFVLKEPLICNEKQAYATYKEAPAKSLDEMISECIPPLKRKHEPKTLMVSSACEAMSMDTD
jgi:hypothetical protein